MSHTSGNILLHMIFSTRGRLPLIKPDFRENLFAYLGGIVREMQGTALIINGTADHVHMLIRIRPVQSAAEGARIVKTNSSRSGYARNGMRALPGRRATAHSLSVNRMCPPFPDTSRRRRNTIRN